MMMAPRGLLEGYGVKEMEVLCKLDDGVRPRSSMPAYGAKLPNAGRPPCHTIFVGHNPSRATWESGHYFANPSNRFWALLEEAGLVSESRPHLDDVLVNEHGFAFCDVIEQPGNDAGSISPSEFRAHTTPFLHRIENYAKSMNGSLKRICFVGKRQWKHLFTPSLTKCEHGHQEMDFRPDEWPASIRSVSVWVLPSPSGRAVISNEKRQAPYNELAHEIKRNR